MGGEIKKIIQISMDGESFNFNNIDEVLEFIKRKWNENSAYLSIRKVCFFDNVMKNVIIERRNTE